MVYSCIAYPGGKKKLVDKIMDLVPDGVEDWREPFMGGLSVTLGFIQSPKSINCKRIVCGDLAPEIWALWAGIQKDSNEVIKYSLDIFNKYMKSFGLDLSNPSNLEKFEMDGRNLWDYLKNVDTSKLSLSERAARTWLINRVSFSGMGDSGSLSLHRLLRFKFEHTEKIREVSSLLGRIEFINAPFQETMSNVSGSSFIFLDPPYANQEKSGLYGKDGDTHLGFNHREFAKFCKNTKCNWLITYDDSVIVRKLFRDKNLYIKPFKISYTMAINASEDALKGEELFIANYDINKDEKLINLNCFI